MNNINRIVGLLAIGVPLAVVTISAISPRREQPAERAFEIEQAKLDKARERELQIELDRIEARKQQLPQTVERIAETSGYNAAAEQARRDDEQRARDVQATLQPFIDQQEAKLRETDRQLEVSKQIVRESQERIRKIQQRRQRIGY